MAHAEGDSRREEKREERLYQPKKNILTTKEE
jgi:hypothetical protein